jgi:hypothetical protein
MANLNVQPKKKNYLWLWIIIILLIAAGIYYYLNYYRKGIKPGSGNTLGYPIHSRMRYAEQPVNKVNTCYMQAGKFLKPIKHL